jgi:hypothetical protein
LVISDNCHAVNSGDFGRVLRGLVGLGPRTIYLGALQAGRGAAGRNQYGYNKQATQKQTVRSDHSRFSSVDVGYLTIIAILSDISETPVAALTNKPHRNKNL